MMQTGKRTDGPGWLLMVVVLLFSGCAGFPENGADDRHQQDSADAVRLKAVLLDAPDLAGSAIDVSISEDRVLLEGFVETDSQRQRAEELVRQHSDGRQVSNRIQVK